MLSNIVKRSIGAGLQLSKEKPIKLASANNRLR